MSKAKNTVIPKIQNLGPLQAFKSLTGGKDEMDEEAFSAFITQTLQLPEDGILQFYIMTIGMQTPKLGHIKLENFSHLFKFSGACKTIKQLKKLIPKFEKDLTDPRIFKQMYNSVFESFLVKNLSMEFQYAEALWGILLANIFVYQKEFKLYLDSLGPKKLLKCHKDLWHMMYDFATVVKDVNKDYKEGDAWPVFLDNFVEFMREQGLVK